MSEELKLPEGIKLSGRVEARGFDAKYIKTYKDYLIAKNRGLLDKVTIWKDVGPNRVVDVGVSQICDLIVGSNTNYPSHCQNGTGNTVVTAGDVDLTTPVTPRIPISYKYRSGLSFKVDTFFTANDENATWAECALFTALTGGIMYCRRLYASTFVKTTTNTATVTWTITLAPQ